MLNIKSLDYRLRFLEDIIFKEEPEIALFKAIFKRLKSILCINQRDRCIDCINNKKCLYNYMSAGDFEYIDSMPIIINKPLFSERSIKKDDVLELNFILLGDSIIHMDFLHYILKEFETRGLFKERYKFCIEGVTEDNVNLSENNDLISSIEILTPIDNSKYIFETDKEKVERLNKLYNITDKKLSIVAESYDFDAVKFDIKNPLYMGSNRIMRRGYVGKVDFKMPVPNNSLLNILNIIGMGKFYGIGGGQIKLHGI